MVTGPMVIIFKEYDNLKVGFGVPTGGHGIRPAMRLQVLELRWGPVQGPGPKALPRPPSSAAGEPCPKATAKGGSSQLRWPWDPQSK